MKRDKLPRGGPDLVWLTGWVFADLLLALMVIFLVSMRAIPPTAILLDPTMTPTELPTPTGTRYPTSTFTPTLTPTPTRTLTPTLTGTPALTATLEPVRPIGINRRPYNVYLRTDPSLFFNGDANNRRSAEQQLRDQIAYCFSGIGSSKVGMVFASGYNQKDTNGQLLAKRSIELLAEVYPGAFGEAIRKDLHILTNEALNNGRIDLEMYFLEGPGLSAPRLPYDTPCTPPPKTWCEGAENNQKLIVYNWDVRPSLTVVVDTQPFTVESASGQTGEDRTVGCIMLAVGTHSLQAGVYKGTLKVETGRDYQLQLCGNPASLCSDTGPLPFTGEQGAPTPTRAP